MDTLNGSPTGKKPPVSSPKNKKKIEQVPTRNQLLNILRAKEAIDHGLVQEIDHLKEVCHRQQKEHA
jgi:hypothetical protein